MKVSACTSESKVEPLCHNCRRNKIPEGTTIKGRIKQIYEGRWWEYHVICSDKLINRKEIEL